MPRTDHFSFSSLGHGAFNDVPMNPLPCEQANVRNSSPHMLGSIAVNFVGESQAVRPLVLRIEHVLIPSVGCSEFRRQSHPVALELKGSDAATRLST
jgi:hypothetical protein